MSDEPEVGEGEPGPESEPAEPAEPAPPAASPPEPPGRRIFLAAIVGLVVALLAAAIGVVYARSDWGGGGCPPDGVVVQVRDRKITQAAFDRRLELLRALYGVERPVGDDAKRADSFPRDVAKSLAVGLIIEAEVSDRDLKAADRAVRDSLDRFVADRYPEGGRAEFIEALGNQGVSEADVIAEFRRLLQTRRLFESVTAGTKVTDADVARAFEDRKAQLAVPESRRLRHLVVATEEEAKAALGRVAGGEPFATVAKAISLDASTKEGGGDLGPLRADQLAESFSKAGFAATPGTPFGPVKTDLGWHVGLVEEVIPGRPVTVDEVRTALSDQLVAEAGLAKWRTYLGEQIKDAHACYADGFRPAEPDAPPPDIGAELVPQN